MAYFSFTVNYFLVYFVILDHEAYMWYYWAMRINNVSHHKNFAFASAKCLIIHQLMSNFILISQAG